MDDALDDLRRIEMEIERERRVPDPSVPQRTPQGFPTFDPLTGCSKMLPGDLRDFAERYLRESTDAAKREERSRIRRELLNSILPTSGFLEVLDRILPEDG